MSKILSVGGMTVDVAATKEEARAHDIGVTWGAPTPRDGYTGWFFPRQSGFYKISLPMHRWLRARIADYDLVHIHGLFSFACMAAALAAKQAGVPYIVRPLGVLNRWEMEHSKRWFKMLSFHFLERGILKGASCIHFTSEREQLEASRLGLDNKYVIIPPGVQVTGSERPLASDFLNAFPQCMGHRLVLFLSRLAPKKGMEILLDSFVHIAQVHRDAMLVLAGDGDPVYVSALKDKACSLGIEDRVVWTGFLVGDERLSALQAAHLFVLPSFSENFGIALLEAMATGLPCVSTEHVALAEEVAPFGAVLIAQLNAASIAESICKVLQNKELSESLGRKARMVASERYSLEAMGSVLTALYSEIVGSRT